MSKPTTGKYSQKLYACELCGYEEKHGTNHWGKFYNTHCKGCGQYSAWVCKEPCPDTHELPPEWTTVKLGDIAEIK